MPCESCGCGIVQFADVTNTTVSVQQPLSPSDTIVFNVTYEVSTPSRNVTVWEAYSVSSDNVTTTSHAAAVSSDGAVTSLCPAASYPALLTDGVRESTVTTTASTATVQVELAGYGDAAQPSCVTVQFSFQSQGRESAGGAACVLGLSVGGNYTTRNGFAARVLAAPAPADDDASAVSEADPCVCGGDASVSLTITPSSGVCST